jgi:pimeloyl-ACP methyl ester carboxylesterase
MHDVRGHAGHAVAGWDRVTSLLGAAGVRTVAVELPFTSFKDDVNCVRTAIAQVGTPVVLCGHSYGGAVITEAGNEPMVGQLVYLCAFAVAEGYSTAHPADQPLPRTGLPVGLHVAEDGIATFDVSLARDTFYGDCEPADVELARTRLRPMAADGLTAPVTRAAWRNVPSLYAVCTNDMAIHPSGQRMLAAHCSEVVEWPSSHSPFLSQPTVVADLLVTLTTRVCS